MSRTGTVTAPGRECLVLIKKRIWLTGGGRVRVEYDLTPDDDLDVLFAPEWNLSFLTPEREWVTFHADDTDGSGLRRKKSLNAVGAMRVDDRLRGQRLSICCEPAAGVWTWPLDTASRSEDGLERVFQGLTLVTHWPIKIGGGESASFAVEFGFSPLPKE